MDPSQANPQDYLRQVIDAEIKTLEGSIRVLRRRRNALAPISSLPTEVILTIFALLRTTGPGRKLDHLAWLRVTYVCHQWREIALHHPLFWSHLDFTTVSSSGAAEILARARAVPLHLEANIPYGQWNGARFSALRKELQDHVSYIRHLEFSTADLTQFNRTLNGLTSPAPTLESLCLTCQEYPNGTKRTLPDTLFDGSTPRLSYLKLYQCEFSWESPLLRGLKHLNIDTPMKRPSLSIWLDALDEMPNLKTLVSHWASPTAHPDTPLPFRVERTVSLPSLKLLEIFSEARDCGLTLTHLVLPSLTTLCLQAVSHHPDGRDVSDIFPYVTRHANGFRCTQPLRSVFVRSGNSMYIDVVGWTLPDVDIDDDMDFDMLNGITVHSTHSIQIAFSFVGRLWSPETHTNIFDAMMADLPLDNLVTLAVHKHSELDEHFWIRQAPQWPLLQHIRLAPPAAHGFEEMLLQENHGRRTGPLLPLLKKLVLVDPVLSARRTLHLRDALMNRVEQGVPLETLDLSKCLETNRAVELLSEIVVEVLGPEEALEKKAQMFSRWDSTAHGFFVEDDSPGSSGVEDHWHHEDNTNSGNNDEGWYDEDWFEPRGDSDDDSPVPEFDLDWLV